MFIIKGKKEKAENSFLQSTLQFKKFFDGRLNFQHTFKYLLNWAKPWFEMRKFIKRGELQDYPRLVLKDRGYAKSMRQMAVSTKKSFEHRLWEKIFDGATSTFLDKTGSELNE